MIRALDIYETMPLLACLFVPLPVLDNMNDALRIVTTAVTPVVMVSATAILISGVNARYLAVSDRVRALAHEFRLAEVTPDRRRNIQLQMRVFQDRIKLVSRASRCLYTAAFCFVFVALLISISVWQKMLEWVTLPAFVAGLSLVALAIGLQLAELQRSNRSIHLEAEDVLNEATDVPDSSSGKSGAQLNKSRY